MDDPDDEHRHRRQGWTQGLPVILADGQVWYLPRIDQTLLLTISGMPFLLVRAFRTAEDVSRHPIESGPQLRVLSSFHTQMVRVAVLLLHSNYDRPAADWAESVAFEDTAPLFRLTTAVAGIVFLADKAFVASLAAAGGVDPGDHLAN